MPSTTHYDPAFKAWAFQTRTDEAGSDVEDSDASEGRLPWSMFSPGVRGGDEYVVTADGTDMTVDVGSGSTFSDLAVVEGLTAGQGRYGLLLEAASQSLTVPAADLSNARIDEVYLVVMDDPGTMVKARLAYRAGDPAASPSAPGPDASWDGYLLLASVNVGAGVTVINSGDVDDERVTALPVAPGDAVRSGGVTTNGPGVTFTTSYTTQTSDVVSLPVGWKSARLTAVGAIFFYGSVDTGQVDARITIGSSLGDATTQNNAQDNDPTYLSVRHEADIDAGETVALEIRRSGSSTMVAGHAWIQWTLHRIS